MNLRPLLALLALLIPLAAYAGDERFAYTCDNGSHIDISFSADVAGRPQATLHFSDEAMTLPQVPAASGALYRQGEIRLHTRGDEAIFEDGKNNLRRCKQGSSPASVPEQPATPAGASSFIELSGNVSYLSRIALPPEASLIIRIKAGRRTLVEQRYELNGAQVPIPFSATVDRDLIGRKNSATVSARIDIGGKPFMVSDKAVPAMKNGQPVAASIVLKPLPRQSR